MTKKQILTMLDSTETTVDKNAVNGSTDNGNHLFTIRQDGKQIYFNLTSIGYKVLNQLGFLEGIQTILAKATTIVTIDDTTKPADIDISAI